MLAQWGCRKRRTRCALSHNRGGHTAPPIWAPALLGTSPLGTSPLGTSSRRPVRSAFDLPHFTVRPPWAPNPNTLRREHAPMRRSPSSSNAASRAPWLCQRADATCSRSAGLRRISPCGNALRSTHDDSPRGTPGHPRPLSLPQLQTADAREKARPNDVRVPLVSRFSFQPSQREHHTSMTTPIFGGIAKRAPLGATR